MSEPLNAFLYKRLSLLFNQVRITSEGEAMVGQVIYHNGIKQFEVINPGEYYMVSCPYCQDTRFRLCINHRWGVGVPGDPSNALWEYINCFNETHCVQGRQNFQRRRELAQKIYFKMGPSERAAVQHV